MAGHTSKHPFDRLTHLLRLERNDLWVCVIFSAAIGLLTLVVPIATQSLVNTIAFGNLLQPLVVLTGVVMAVLGLSTVLQTMRFHVVEILQRRLFVRVASDAANRLLRARADALEEMHGPELVNRFLEVVTLQKSGATLLVDGLSVGMQTLVGSILLAFYHPYLLAFVMVLMGAILVIVFPLGRGAVATAIEESKAKYDLMAWLEETARHPTTFRSDASRRYALERTNELVGEYLSHRGSHFRILLRQVVGTWVLYALASALLLGVGGWLVIQRQLTLGQLIASELVLALVLSGFSKLGKHLETYYDLLAAMDKLGYLTDLPLESPRDSGPGRGPSGVDARGLIWRGVLQGVDVTIRPRERLGLAGSSGSGKTTLIDILCGFREADGGSVVVDGPVAVVRGPEVFHGTIEENVRVGRSASLDEVRRALQTACVWDDVLSLPDGLSTTLATGGRPLSGGQVMRLMFARAIVARPGLLIVDEALDGLDDSAWCTALVDALFAPDAPWTLLVVTNREDLLNRCDRVLRLKSGQVIELTPSR
jgi:ABC-type bacteriocin/lantibiotic exporter with double-glycine peptidase domain